MLYPEINMLRDAAGNRYYLVVMAAKRARDVISGRGKLDPEITTLKPVSIAAEEIGEGLITFREMNEEEVEEQERQSRQSRMEEEEEEE